MPKDSKIVNDKTIIAFDFGLQKIGVAVGNILTKTTTPLDIIYFRTGTNLWKDIELLLDEWKPSSIIVGDPINMDGTVSEMSCRARKFAQRVHGRFAIKVLMVDERLTSFEAKSLSLRTKVSKGYANGNIDSLAAEIILTSWMKISA